MTSAKHRGEALLRIRTNCRRRRGGVCRSTMVVGLPAGKIYGRRGREWPQLKGMYEGKVASVSGAGELARNISENASERVSPADHIRATCEAVREGGPIRLPDFQESAKTPKVRQRAFLASTKMRAFRLPPTLSQNAAPRFIRVSGNATAARTKVESRLPYASQSVLLSLVVISRLSVSQPNFTNKTAVVCTDRARV